MPHGQSNAAYQLIGSIYQVTLYAGP
jgi:hypothetical protein